MWRYVLGRILVAFPTLLLCTLIVFFVGALSGRSYYDKKKSDPNVDLAQIRAEERAEKLHEPLPVQYLHWLARLCFDVYLGRPEYRIQDFEDATWRDPSIRLSEGEALVQVRSDAASGRYALGARAAAEKRARVEFATPADHLRRVWDGIDSRTRRSWERFERPANAKDPLDAELFDVVLIALRAGSDEARAAGWVVLTMRSPSGGSLWEERIELKANADWSEVAIPVGPFREAETFELEGDGDFLLDSIRTRERNWRIALGPPNLGRSAKYDRDVLAVLRPYLANTLLLGVLALIVTWGVAIPLGVWCGVHRNGPIDRIFSGLAFLGMSLPSFFLALVVLWFCGIVINDLTEASLGFALFPTGGGSSGTATTWWGGALDRLRHLVLPVLVVSVGSVAALQRVTRGNLIDVLGAQYVRTARAKGLPEKRVLYRHALRNALHPLVTLFGFQLSALLSGAALVEIIFSYPGMGKVVLEAIRDQDRNVVMAAVLASGVLLVVGNLLADLALALLDPRIRLGGSADGG